MRHLGLVTVVVDDYDTAVAFYVGALGFVLTSDDDQGEGRRWVVVKPSADAQTGLLLAVAGTPEQRERIGDQTGGRVGFFLTTDDFAGDLERFRAAGVRLLEEPRSEPYGDVVVFADRYGNRWDLIQPR